MDVIAISFIFYLRLEQSRREFKHPALIIHFVLLQNLTKAQNSFKAAGNLSRYLRLIIVSQVLFSIRWILFFCDLASGFTSTCIRSFLWLRWTVRELRFMIRKRTQRLVYWDWCMYWDKCMYFPQSTHALIYFLKCRKFPAQLTVC